jgi:polysaccharide biosynthesis transport protein
MSIEQLLSVLRARWLIAAGVFVLVFGTVAAFTWWMPKNYTAVATVLVDVKSPDPIAGTVPQALMTQNFLLTQVDVITSGRVSQRVVNNLKLTEVPALRSQWMKATGGIGSFEGYVAQLIRSGLEARPSRGSNVINLSYQSSDPAFAATIVNAYVAAYLDISMEMRTDPAKRYGDFFDANAKQLREKLEAAQKKLSEFQQAQGLVVTEERMDVEMTRLNELSQTYVSMQTAVADSESRRTAVNAGARNTQDVMSSPLVVSLKQDVVRVESQLAQVLTRLGERHPVTIELKTNLDDARAKLDAEIQRVSNSVNVNNTINVSRASQVKASLEEQRAKVLKMKQMRDEAAMLERDVLQAQRTYEGVLARLNMSTLEAQAQQNNIMPLEVAPVPSIPTSPRIFSNLLLGMLGGLMLALATVFMVERFDRRLRTSGEIEVLFQLPHVGTIPSFRHQLQGKLDWRDRMRMAMPRLKTLSR